MSSPLLYPLYLITIPAWCCGRVALHLGRAVAETFRSAAWLRPILIVYVGYWTIVAWLAQTTSLHLVRWIRRETFRNDHALVRALGRLTGWPVLPRACGWWLAQERPYWTGDRRFEVMAWFFWLDVFTIPLLILAPCLALRLLWALMPRSRRV